MSLPDRASSAAGVAATGLVAIGLAAMLSIVSSDASAADEFPRRKAGLWDMKTTGGPFGARTVQQCIDAATDDLLRTQSNEGQNCSRPAVERDGSRYRVHTTCDKGGIRSTIDANYTMSRDTDYSGDMKMTFDPPMSGVAEMNMKMNGRWIGACKPGMKPGDVVMEGMPRLNALEIDKPQPPDPAIR